MNELALKAALHELASGQPDAPVDRFASVRRRHVRRRVAMASAAAASAVVAVVTTLLVVSPLGAERATPADRPVPAWALPWPDHRDGSVSQQTLDKAVDAWRHFHAGPNVDGLPAPTKVVWYVGQLAVNNDKVVVMFEVDGAEGHRLVAGLADANNVDGSAKPHFAPGSSPWVLYDVAAPTPKFRGLIGLNLSGLGGDGSYENWIVVLTRPDVQQLSWSAEGISGGSMTPDRGLVVADTGQPWGQVYGSIIERVDRIGPGQRIPIGVPGAPKSRVPQLAPVADPQVNERADLQVRGQGASLTRVDDLGHAGGRAVVYVRCRGVGVIHVSVSRSTRLVGPADPLGTASCDGQQHRLVSEPLDPGKKFRFLEIDASDYAAWSAVLVAR